MTFNRITLPLQRLWAMDGRTRRRAAYAVSAMLLVGSAWSALTVFPFLTGTPSPTGAYRAQPVGDAFRPDERVLVYDIVGPSKTRRSGAANVGNNGIVRLARYDGRAAAAGQRTHAVMMAANIRTLWVLASDSEREELHNAVDEFGKAVGLAFRQALTSPEFEAEYRPQFIAAVRRAASGAWQAPATRDALAELWRISQPTVNHLTTDIVRPAVMERLQPALWATVKENTARLFDVFNGFQFDFRQMEKAVYAALADPKVVSEAGEAAELLAGTPQMRTFAEVFASELAERLSKDRELADTIGAVMSDGRLARYLAAMGGPGLTLARATPRTLAQLDEKADLNSLAADIFKQQARGYSGHVIIFMSQQESQRVMAIDPLAAVVLTGDRLP